MSITLDELTKAASSLDIAIALLKTSSSADADTLKVIRDGCIQRFEYCIELSWKTAMKILGSQTMAAKPAIREMARNNLIDNPDLWLSFIEARNQSSHSYDEDIAQKVYAYILQFQPEVKKLIGELKKLI